MVSLSLSVVFKVEQASGVDADSQLLVHKKVHSKRLEGDCSGTVAVCGCEPFALPLHLPPAGKGILCMTLHSL